MPTTRCRKPSFGWPGTGKLAKVDNLDAYVFTVARNEAARLAAGRARRQRGRTPLGGEELFRASPGDGEAREAAELVAAALGELSVELREVVELKTYGGLTFQQISQATGLPQGTVATRYRSALAKMNAWIGRRMR